MKKLIVLIFLFLAFNAHAFNLSVIGGGQADSIGDVTPPEFSSASIAADGDTVTINFNENVTGTEIDTFTLDCVVAGDPVAMTYASGSGTPSLVFTAGSTITSADSCTLDFNGDANDFEDDSNNDLADFDTAAVTNNSEQGGDAQQEAGYATIGGTENATSNDRCQKFTVGATNMTVSHAYFYGNYNGTGNDLTFAVYADSGGSMGSQVGSCSDGGDLPQSASAAWHERTWSSADVTLTATNTYWLCRYTDTDLDEFWDSEASASLYGAVAPGGCPSTVASVSSRKTTMTVSNYDVR